MKTKLLLFSLLLAFSASAQQVLSDENPLSDVSGKPGMTSIFRTWGFIGDSLSSGELESRNEDGSKGYHDFYEYSWGQYLCRAAGATGDNYSQGGETASGWIRNFWDNPSNRNNNISAKDSPKQAYIIALGVNDCTRGDKPGNVLTDINHDDFLKNADTFAGNYGGIIQRVKSIQPQAKFFVVTMPSDGHNRDEYIDVIRQMPQVFDNVYLIDLAKYAPDYSKGSYVRNNFYVGGHLNAAGYLYTSWLMMCYIDWIICNNMEDFSQVGFIGTGLKY